MKTHPKPIKNYFFCNFTQNKSVIVYLINSKGRC